MLKFDLKCIKLPIFWRLVLGNVFILILATAVSAYAIFQLYKMRNITNRIVKVHSVLIDLDQQMTAALLSEIRNERKFSLVQDQTLYKGFLASKAEFDRHWSQAMTCADTPTVKNSLQKVQQLNATYQGLFEDEVASLRHEGAGPKRLHDREKRRAVNQAMGELARLRAASQQRILLKVAELDEAGAAAATVAMVITGIALVLGIALSIIITRSITQPLSRMKKKTAEVARGSFEADLDIASPPEIMALAGAFNTMCSRLKEVDRMKSDFYSLMSHELRTPLTSIREGTDMFLEGVGGEVTDKQRELLVIMSEESSRLLVLVSRLLELSKLESGALKFNFALAEPAPLIARTIRELAPLAAAKGIDIESEMEEIAPLSLEEERILQVLRNLIGNALKFTPQGGTVRVSLRSSGREVTVSVTDSGPGIGKDEIGVIFEKFRQASNGVSPRFQGTGLGLAIVKHVVEAHGGRVWVESEIGRGSTFILALPA